jgi:DNA repair protein RecN (Recombination protein N)
MLTSLRIRNFALIDNLELTFGAGLNILTGETGAGKSIIIDALGVALGERASADLIRSETDRFSVEAVFTLSDTSDSTRAKLLENSLENEDDLNTLVMAREVSKSGKSQCRVNGRLVPTAILRVIGQDLVDVHGQHEHQSLLSPDTHIDLLDNWLGSELLTKKSALAAMFVDLTSARRALEQLQSEARERARNADLYRFQRDEIEQASLSIDEQETLTAERTKLANSERLMLAAEETYSSLSTTAIDAINTSLSTLTKAADLDPNVLPILEQVTEASVYLEEAASQIRRYRETLEPEPGRLEAVNERLDVIHLLERKYGDTVAEVLAYGKDLEQKLFTLEDTEYREEQLTLSVQALQTMLNALSNDLSANRKKGASLFSKAIIAELKDLAMNQTVFAVDVTPGPSTAKGNDKVEFLISTNQGEPLRPLARIASGGETSRLMLAIKSVLSRSSYIPTMVFDEIDTGIGGRTGRVLANKLASLSKIAQILCITHLPQIASRPAATHFSIEKSVAAGRTTVSVLSLNPGERETEIARMLGGEDSQTVLQHAREMLAAT